ncbi:MAG: phosphoethanolamine transferase [Rickettsiales bacterium]
MLRIKPLFKKIARWHDRRALIAGLALVYTALFLPAILSVQPEGLKPYVLAQLVVGSFAYSWAFFFTLRAVRPLFLLLTPLLFFASAVASYFMHAFHFEMTFQQLAVITEVQTQTALAFITVKLVLWSLFSTFVGYRLARWCVRQEVRDPKDARVLFITCILMLCIFTQEVGTITQRYFPYNLLFAAKGFVAEKLTLARQGDGAAEAVSYDTKKPPVTVVLIVGESVRAQNWGLNGYARQTTPLLAKRHGLINYTDVTSCFPLTRIAVPCILTDATHEMLTPGSNSLLKIFRQMGFFTASIDMHGMSESVFGSPVSKLLNDGNRLVSFNGGFLSENNVDDKGVESLRGILGEHKENLFVLFHPFGSHWPFDTRYPEKFRQFKPVCNPLHASVLALSQDMAACVPEELVNAYDNSILYADFITNEVMEAVKGRAALVLYTSDHGQSLGEEGLFLHGHEKAIHERRVPLVLWATPEFEKHYPRGMKALRAKQHAATSHDAIFHSLLDCVGAKGNIINPKLSLCQ